MELVRAASLTGYFAVAGELQAQTSCRLLRRAGLSRTMMSDPEQMLPARSVVHLLEDSADASGCTTFGLRMAEHRQLSDIGLVSLLIVHQPTPGRRARCAQRISQPHQFQPDASDRASRRRHFPSRAFRAAPSALLAAGKRSRARRSLQALPVGDAASSGVRNASASATSGRLRATGRFTTACSTAHCSSGPISTVL